MVLTRMRVGLDGYPLCERLTGVGHYTFELARALARTYTSCQFELIAPFQFDVSVLAQIQREQLSNLKLINLNLSSVRGRWWSLHLPRYIKRAALDLFHGTNYELPLWNRRCTVVTVHDLSSLCYPELHRKQLARRMRVRLPLTVKLAKAIITPTAAVKQELCTELKVKPAKVTAIHEAPRESFSPVSREAAVRVRKRLGVEDDFLLFVGTLEPRKNLGTLLKAFAQMIRETPLRPQLVVAGGAGWLMDETFVIMQDPDIRERLCLTGYLHDDDLRALYSSCRAFIYPSLYEGFGLPPLEAMATGAPVIASRAAALLETLGEAAILVDPLDVQGLSQAMVALLAAETRRAELIEKGRTQAAKFSWRRTAELTYDVYQRCVSAGRA